MTMMAPIPLSNAYWAGLISMMYLTIDDMQRDFGVLKNVWIDVVSQVVPDRHRMLSFQRKGVDLANAVAVVGDGFSGDYEGSAYAGVLGLPICDGLAFSDVLLDEIEFPTFFRTRPSVTVAFDAALKFCVANGWNKITLIRAPGSSTSMITRAVANVHNVTIEHEYTVDIAANQVGTSILCSTALSSIKSTLNRIIIFYGEAEQLASCLEASGLLSMRPNDGYVWIISEVAMIDTWEFAPEVIRQFPGILAFRAAEGIGPKYDQFLKRWNNETLRQQYPFLGMTATPPPGYLFYRSCMQSLMLGFDQIINNSTKAESQQVLKALTTGGHQLALQVLQNITIPDSFYFPNFTTEIGIVEYRQRSRYGATDLYYSNGSEFRKIGIFGPNDSYLDTNLLNVMGWINISDTITPNAVKSSELTDLIIGFISILVLMLGAGCAIFIVLLDKLKNSAKILADAEKELEKLRDSPKFQFEGSGSRALELLDSLKNKRLRKGGYFTKDDFDFLIEAFIAGNSSFVPNLENQEERGGIIIDKETRDFVLSSMLTTSVRQAPLEPIAERSHLDIMVKSSSTGSISSQPSSQSPSNSRLRSILETKRQSLVRSNSRNSKLSRNVAQEGKKRFGARLLSWESSHLDSANDRYVIKEEAELESNENLTKGFGTEVANGAVNNDPLPSGTDSVTKVPQPPKEMKYRAIMPLLQPISEISVLDTDSITAYLQREYQNWNVDLFYLTEISGGHPLYFSGAWLLESTGLLEKFNIGRQRFRDWIWLMESEYKSHPYHNCLHAADVLHAFNYMLMESPHGSHFTEVERLAGLIAAIGHDIDHPGYTNQFLIKSRHPMAILYSDCSVNEFHHCAHVFNKTESSAHNIFSSFPIEYYDEMRRIVIRLILCTDMSRHFEYLTKFKTKIQTGGFRLDAYENRIMVLEMAIKCADLNNPSKAPQLALRWVSSIMEEFYRQGDAERERGLPISQFMDRNNPNVPKCQQQNPFWAGLIGLLYMTLDILQSEQKLLSDVWINIIPGLTPNRAEVVAGVLHADRVNNITGIIGNLNCKREFRSKFEVSVLGSGLSQRYEVPLIAGVTRVPVCDGLRE
ncbi:cAMP-specific 3',5'-cyclic phosphodiesterase 4D [Blyttiomyces sp. JEL0837]|nr:cAMP-specific 3',5'-cyclic phosphodiesterase 4D [Blyttiomyces sp. JEL0837]